MRVKVLSRHPDNYMRETKNDIFKLPRNYDPSLHPFEVPREYTKALNAVKLEKVFAKPFLKNLHGHKDGISCLEKHHEMLSLLLSGGCDGELRIWDLSSQKCLRAVQAHEGFIRDIAFDRISNKFYTCGDDKNIHLWQGDIYSWKENELPKNSILSQSIVMSISHHMQQSLYATCGEHCLIWDDNRNEPLKKFSWDVDSLHHVRFNPVQVNLLASCASDCSIILYDLRGESPIRKVTMNLKSNSLCWNPMEAFVFAVANEDYNVALNVFQDHTSAVIDLDYAPTGKEIVSGSYDKTIRIFTADKSHSRDVYHTKRMQRLTCVLWSQDNNYIISGSDEMNIRLWKAQASAKLGILHPREKADLQYNQQLKAKFGHHPHIKRIARFHHVPKHIYNARKELQAIGVSKKKKEANLRVHSHPDTVPFISERQKHIRKEQE